MKIKNTIIKVFQEPHGAFVESTSPSLPGNSLPGGQTLFVMLTSSTWITGFSQFFNSSIVFNYIKLVFFKVYKIVDSRNIM
jgi:hypothetical protein